MSTPVCGDPGTPITRTGAIVNEGTVGTVVVDEAVVVGATVGRGLDAGTLDRVETCVDALAGVA